MAGGPNDQFWEIWKAVVDAYYAIPWEMYADNTLKYPIDPDLLMDGGL